MTETSSRGRIIPDRPTVRLDTNRKCINDFRKYHKWLWEQGIEEAAFLNDDYVLTLFLGMNEKRLSRADSDCLYHYLFQWID